MEMIIGGAFQGKMSYAKEQHQDVNWVDGKTCDFVEINTAGGIFHFETYIERWLKAGQDVSELAETIYRANPGLIIVSREVGYGIVPMDPFDRMLREAVGRTCTGLAAHATKVTRVICGIGTVIKDVEI